jgi:predicted dehydrogenase
VVACGHEVTVVANHREETARVFAERHGIGAVTTDWLAVARDPSIGAVVIATPNALHAPQAIAALEAGKHVLVEKPMAVSVAECDAMIKAAAGSGASLMVAHCWRFHPDVRAMRDRIDSGELGEVVKTRGYGVHAGDGPSGWFVDRALAGGGALPDMGVHAIDTARFLLDDPTPTRVCAVIGTRYGDYDVDDDGILLISWSQGTNSIVESGWWQPHTEGLEAETEVYGTGGYARIFPREEPSEDYEHCTQPMYTAQMQEFLGAIEEGRPPRPSGEDGRAVIEIVEAAYASAEALA